MGLNLAGFLDNLGTVMGLKDEVDRHAYEQQRLQDLQTRSFAEALGNRMLLEQQYGAKPIVNGTVQDQMNAPDVTIGATPGQPTPDTSNIPPLLQRPPEQQDVTTEDLQNLPMRGTAAPGQQYSFLRAPGGNGRTVMRGKDAIGEFHYELPTTEEQIQNQRQFQGRQVLADALERQRAAVEARKQALGVPGNSAVLPDDVADLLGMARGTRVLNSELPDLTQKARQIQRQDRVTLGPGQSLIDLGSAPSSEGQPPQPHGTENPFASPGSMPSGYVPPPENSTESARPAGPRVIATGAEPVLKNSQEKFIRDWLADNKAADTAQNRAKAIRDYKAANAQDPMERWIYGWEKENGLEDSSANYLRGLTKYKAATAVDRSVFNVSIPGLGGSPGGVTNGSGGPASQLTGQAFLDSLPSGTAAQVKAIAEGRAALPSGSTRSQGAMQLRNAVFQYDPSYTDQRAQVRKAFTSGADGRNIGALNTAAVHLDQFAGAADAMQNGSFRPGNQAWNALRTMFGASAPTNFAGLKSAVSGEIATALKGTATDQEIHEIQSSINAANSPAQLRGYIDTQIHVLGAKLNTYKERYQQQIPGDAVWSPVLPTAQRVFDAHGSSATTTNTLTIQVGNKRYQYKGAGDTTDLKNYTEVKQ